MERKSIMLIVYFYKILVADSVIEIGLCNNIK